MSHRLTQQHRARARGEGCPYLLRHSLLSVFPHFPHGCTVEIQILSRPYVTNVQFFLRFHTLQWSLRVLSSKSHVHVWGTSLHLKKKAEGWKQINLNFYEIYAFFKTVLIYLLIPNFFSPSFLSHFLILATHLPADCWTPRALFRYWGHLINSTKRSWDENLKWQKSCPACYSHLCGINCWGLILCMSYLGTVQDNDNSYTWLYFGLNFSSYQDNWIS